MVIQDAELNLGRVALEAQTRVHTIAGNKPENGLQLQLRLELEHAGRPGQRRL